jgi:Protein of unknown function (DUF3095)
MPVKRLSDAGVSGTVYDPERGMTFTVDVKLGKSGHGDERGGVMADQRDFYRSLPVFSDFGEVVRAESFSPLPDDWFVGFTDVTGSTAAIAAGRYKAVNMVGAGAIAAVANSLGRRPFPFVFGGDGVSLAVSAAAAPAASSAMAAMASFARAEFKLELRAAMIPVSEIRASGSDVRVARFGASEHCVYAMFSGGGLTWFEAQAKKGRYALPPAPADARPDLSGLSCRWGVAPARNGVVLSVIIAPRADDPRFASLVGEIVKMALEASGSERPVTVEALGIATPLTAIGLEATALKASGGARLSALAKAAVSYTLGAAFHKFKLRLGAFDAGTYAADVAANADFRKYDDGLRMTLDCSPAFADNLEAKLSGAAEFAHWGAFRQKSAQITCFVPSITERNHVHFVDGAEGGYTMAAQALKSRMGLATEAR